MSSQRVPGHLRRWSAVLNAWHAWCAQAGVAPLQAALSFVLGIAPLEAVVVGVDSSRHLQDIIAAAQTRASQPPDELSSDEPDLIEPRRWQVT